MHESRNTVNPGGSGKFGDDADPEEVVSYRCSTCMSKVWNCSVPDAQSRILAERAGLAKKRAKNEAFKAADNKAAEAVFALSKSERRTILVQEMKMVILPLVKFIRAALRLRSACF